MDDRATRAVDNADLVMRELRAQIEHQDRLATLGTAAALIVHEYRNLLTPLRAYSQMALDNPGDTVLATKALTQAVACAGHASEIADLILAFAKPEKEAKPAAGSQSEDAAAVAPAVEAALQCLVRDPTKDNIRLEKQIDPSAGVQLRSIALQHVLMNLILNARAAMLPKGGTLRIAATIDSKCSTWNTRDLGRHAAKQMDQGWTQITIEDTGCGMSRAQVREVFEPFVTRNLSSGGIGLGMAVCKRVIEEAGGHIEIESTPGRGTKVTVVLPTGRTSPQAQKACA